VFARLADITAARKCSRLRANNSKESGFVAKTGCFLFYYRREELL
jgi:hypothetical protein